MSNKTSIIHASLALIFSITAFASLTYAGGPSGADPFPRGNYAYAPRELIVRFASKPDGTPRSFGEQKTILDAINGGTVIDSVRLVSGLTLIQLPPDVSVEKALPTFKSTPGLLYAHPNYLCTGAATFPNDPRFDQQWGLHNTGQEIHGPNGNWNGTPDSDIDAPEAWDIQNNASDIVIAVIDSGIDYTHPDLAANIWINPGEDQQPFGIIGPEDWNRIDDDGNGYEDDICGFDFCRWGQVRDSDPMDAHGHGTHVSGIAGAIGNNNVGVAGVCWNVEIMPVRWLNDQNVGGVWDAIASIDYAVFMGATVLNCSWVADDNLDPQVRQALLDEIQEAGENGVLVVAASGNDGRNADIQPRYPAGFPLENIISVMATDGDDLRSWWPWWNTSSNWGAVSVDLAAPGTDILSCVPPAVRQGNLYEYWSGTSMATPFVAGACALVWQANPQLSHLDVKQLILASVDHIPILAGLSVTGGRLNLDKALALATDSCLPICHPDYDDWVLLGRPDCWCTPYQCDGDADVSDSGFPAYFRVYTGDLNLITTNWQKQAGDPTLNPCADVDHQDSGFPASFRVYTNDLNIVVNNWQKRDEDLPGDCADCNRGLLAGAGEAQIDYDSLIAQLAVIWLDPEVQSIIDQKVWDKIIKSVLKEARKQ